MLGALRVAGWAASVLLLAGACRTTAPGKTAPHTSTLDGRATYEVVLEPGSSVSKLVAQRDYIPAAAADDNRPPAYPEQLIGLNLPPQKVVVRIVLDERGQIAGIRPSEVPSEVDGRYLDTFEVAIQKAVREWRFSPARQRTFVDSPDDGSGKPPYKVLKSEVPTRTWFDIRFIFEVHEGKGVVSEVR